MEYRRFGKSMLSTSRIGIGSWIGYSKEALTKEKAKIFEYAYKRGINHFDTASNYGGREAETVMGESLEFVPKDDITIATKYFWPLNISNPDSLLGEQVASIKRINNGITSSIKKLKVEALDIVYINNWIEKEDMKETAIALQREINRGRVLYYGLSNFSHDQLKQWLKTIESIGLEDPIVIQMPFSILNRKPVYDILDIIEERKIGLSVFQVLQGGILTGKYKDKNREDFPKESRLKKFKPMRDSYFQDGKKEDSDTFVNWAISNSLNPTEVAIAWVLSKPFVTNVIAGVQSETQLEDWIAAQNSTLSEEQIKELDNLFK